MDRGIGLDISATGMGKIEYYREDETTLAHLLSGVGLEMDPPMVRGFGRGKTAVSNVTPFGDSRPDVRDELIALLTKSGFEVGPM